MKERARPDTLVGTIRSVWQYAKSDEAVAFRKEVAIEAYMRFVGVPLAFVFHPIALMRAGFLIGDQASQQRDWETLRSMPQPWFLRDRK